MGTYFRVMPAIAAYIGAEYNEDELDAAYKKFINAPEPEVELPDDDEARKGIYWDHWILQGKVLRFVIQFEKWEMLYFWMVRCPDEETYLALKEMTDELFAPYR